MFQSKFWEKLSVQLGIPNAINLQNGGRELARDSGKERFTLDELEKLYDILASNPSIHESNRSVVVETIRSIAEFIIWGDQNEPGVFEFSLEQNTHMMSYLASILSSQATNRGGSVAKQVLQSLGIIIQNISSETGTHFLFSQGHLNSILETKFDFEDEEILGLYISLIKAISLKLSLKTSQLFLQVSTQDGSILGFPLYTEAVKFAHHKDGMVRASVRTVTLNILSVADPYIDLFITSDPGCNYLYDHVQYLISHVVELDGLMRAAEGASPSALSSLDSQMDEVDDVISYSNDVLATSHPFLSHLLSQALWRDLVGPYLLKPLTINLAASSRKEKEGQAGPTISPMTSLFVLERLLHFVTYKPFTSNLVMAVFGGHDPIRHCATLPSSTHGQSGGEIEGTSSIRGCLLSLIRGSSSNPHSSSNALRLLVSASKCKGASPELLEALGVAPRSPSHSPFSRLSTEVPPGSSFPRLLRASNETGNSSPGTWGAGCAACELERPPLTPIGGKVEEGGECATQAGPFTLTYLEAWTAYTCPSPPPFIPPHDPDPSPPTLSSPSPPPHLQSPLGSLNLPPGATVVPSELIGFTDPGMGPLPPLPALISGVHTFTPPTSPPPPNTLLQHPQGMKTLLVVQAPSSNTPQEHVKMMQEVGAMLQQQQAHPYSTGSPGGGWMSPKSSSSSNSFSHSPSKASRASQLRTGSSSQPLSGLRLTNSPAPPPPHPLSSPSIAPPTAHDPPSPQPVFHLASVVVQHIIPPHSASTDTPSAAVIDDIEDVSGDGEVDEGEITVRLNLEEEGERLRVVVMMVDPLGGEGVRALGGEGEGSGPPCPPEGEGEGSDPPCPPAAPLPPPPSPPPSLAQLTDDNDDIAAKEDKEGEENELVGEKNEEEVKEEEEEEEEEEAAYSSPVRPSPQRLLQQQVLEQMQQGHLSRASSPLLDSSPLEQQQQQLQQPPTCTHRQRHTSPSCADDTPSPSDDLTEALLSLFVSPLVPTSSLWNAMHLISIYQVDMLVRMRQDRMDQEALRQSRADGDERGERVGENNEDLGLPSFASLGPSEREKAAKWLSSLQSSVEECTDRVLQEVVGGMWSEALFPLLCIEWQAAAEALSSSKPTMSTRGLSAAETLMAGPAQYPPRPSLAAASSASGGAAAAAAVAQMMGLSTSASSALHAHLAIQRLVSCMLGKQLMSRGSYDSHAPLPAPNGWEARGLDINEGHQVELQASSAIPCIVSFSPGQERRVYFSVSGAPLSRAAEYLSSGLASAAGQQQQQLHPNRGIQIELKNDARLAAGLLHSSAAVVLADPAPTRLNTGIVASLAPLMGSDPMQDKNVQKWLHVHVRPSVRGLLRVLQSATLSNHHKITLPAQQQSEKQGQGGGGFGAKKVGILSAMRQLADGHWVLAFPDAPRSHLACQTVKQHAEKLRSVYAELLLSFVVNGT